MPAATDTQVQHFVDERVRTWAEQARSLYLRGKDHKASIDDVYAALAVGSPTWTDTRTDGPPHLLVPGDVLAWNAFVTDFVAFVESHGDYAKVLLACSHPVSA